MRAIGFRASFLGEDKGLGFWVLGYHYHALVMLLFMARACSIIITGAQRAHMFAARRLHILRDWNLHKP